MNVLDTLGRPLKDLRISVTDKCNFRCTYCMPKEIFGHTYNFLSHDDLLTFEEITRLAHIFTRFGVRKIRLTGGEPLLRHGIENLVRLLHKIPNIEIAMTTNASLLIKKVGVLKEAGLDRLTISLDSLDETTFKSINDVGFPVAKVLEGIRAAEEAGFHPLKINMVVQRGVNEKDIVPMAEHFRGTGHILRYIEFMDVGTTNGWRMDDVVPAGEIIKTINKVHPLIPADPHYRGEVASRYLYKDGGGEIGIIASVTQPFCRDCTRIRLSAKGGLYTCLFGVDPFDLRGMLRSGATDDKIFQAIVKIWEARVDHYSEIRSNKTSDLPKVEMSFIGG